MREYRVGEHVVIDGGLWEVSKLEAVTKPWDGDENYKQRVGLTQTVDGEVVNVMTTWRNTEIECMEAEAIGRLMEELPKDAPLWVEYPRNGGCAVSLLCRDTEEADHYADGDNLGHALWNLREKVRETER